MLCTLMETVEIALKDDIDISEKQYWTNSTINLFEDLKVNINNLLKTE